MGLADPLQKIHLLQTADVVLSSIPAHKQAPAIIEEQPVTPILPAMEA
jgi:hypothetical protein